MPIRTVAHDDTFLTLGWADGSESRHALIWLRDNDPAGFHPDTGERVFDLLSVPDAPELAAGKVVEGGDAVTLTWADGHVSRFDETYLSERALIPVESRAEAPVRPESWDGGFVDRIPHHDASALMADDGALLDWLEDLTRWGLTIVDGVAAEAGGLERLCERVAFLRQTNFGVTFDVRSIPHPNNQAYTADALPLHTDLTNQETPPGFQFLHTIENDAEGGESTFADGIRIAEDLHAADPEAYCLLVETRIPCRFFDETTDIRYRRALIREDRKGLPVEINYNAHLADTLDLPPEETVAFYRAYRAFMRLTREPGYILKIKTRPGQVVGFNNRRTLHGRSAFDPNTGRRHLRGCYLDWTDVMSRIRVLQRG